jgi:TetR/AcrR family transcriptional regulator
VHSSAHLACSATQPGLRGNVPVHTPVQSECYGSFVPRQSENAKAVGSPPRRRLRAADRRAQIIAEAREVFVEQGVHATRAREIAERAGITEAYLYRHFRSKDEIFQLAIDEPLKALIGRLRDETRELAARDDVDRASILLRSHELFLECMVEIAPLAAAALLAPNGPNRTFFSDYLVPRLREVLVVTIPDITGLPIESIDVDMYAEAMLGIHLTIALEQMLENKPVDVPFVARQVTEMFASGITRTPAQRGAARRRVAAIAESATKSAADSGRRGKKG